MGLRSVYPKKFLSIMFRLAYCHSHGKSLPSIASLMVGKRVLQGEAWSDLSDSYGTHDLGDKLGDHFGTWRQIDDSRKCNSFLDISIRGRDPGFS
ncbi:hypothetical protein AVEN_181861-1 [Araneus ventricosus]|uniref:Uncharacterized protein n=1 Tax=Araneus ventricosus TaxID=182803 RepID=A0A4Y2HJP8_ARAVE|nr:hypothetical protein AVEN_85262-1 [Araneus ventricosus]GBM65557.1 hypothetical protein AVEN_88882-1 [Araneus ventricosus]GBM65581.1 hypothetical protein AVEN_168845-1 [Araneus ventricosus]GBM65588.1 hypothetical protein AVEN_181861-1 [Araneus ventricosus]